MRTFVPFLSSFLIILVGCTEPKPDGVPTEVAVSQEDARDAEREAAKDRLERFLIARWALDPSAAEHVTSEDQDNVWRYAFEPVAAEEATSAGFEPGSLYEWKIVDFEVDGDRAVGRVEVALPTSLLIQASAERASRLAMEKAKDAGEDPYEAYEAAKGTVLPTRYLVELDYSLVRDDQGWRVKMGWSSFPKEPPRLGDPLVVPEDFSGSERWWFRSWWASSSSPYPKGIRKLIRAMSDAESNMRRLRVYDSVLAEYDEMIAANPEADFLRSRKREIEAERDQWKDILETAQLDVQSSLRAEKGGMFVDFEVENQGEDRIAEVRVEAMLFRKDIGGRSADVVITGLDPGRTKVGSVPVYEDRPFPEVGIELVEITSTTINRLVFDEPELRDRFASPDDLESGLRILDAVTNGDSSRALVHFDQLLLRAHDKTARCAGWPGESIVVDVTVDSAGMADSAVHAGDDEFRSCIRDSLQSLRFEARDEPITLRAQLISP